jgi:hypothetical protein
MQICQMPGTIVSLFHRRRGVAAAVAQHSGNAETGPIGKPSECEAGAR